MTRLKRCQFCGRYHSGKKVSLVDSFICKRGSLVRLIAYAPLYDGVEPVVLKPKKVKNESDLDRR